MGKSRLYLAAAALGITLMAGTVPLQVQATNISPNAGGTVITDSDVPLSVSPGSDSLTDIFDEDVPMAAVPTTGDSSGLWYGIVAASVAGLTGVSILEKKKHQVKER